MAHSLARAGPALVRRLASRPRLAICLDVDGTLAPLAADPARARVPAATRRILQRLRRHPGVVVVIVSGRRADEARRVVGCPVDWTIGNHGFEAARGGARPRPLVSGRLQEATRRARHRIADALVGLPDVSLEDKGWTLAVHFRARTRRRALAIWRRVRSAARGASVYLRRGKQVIDVRPAVGWHKGKAVGRVLARVVGRHWERRAGLIYAGDDVTDEDAFRWLPAPAVTIKVGPGPSGARYRTRSPRSLARWLAELEGSLEAVSRPRTR